MNDLYCDRCGAVGKTLFIFKNGNDLVLCGHHTREHQDALLDIVEDAYELDKTPLGV